MKIDNTPTIQARRRKPTRHMRLRLEKAKELKAQGKDLKGKPSMKPKGYSGETDPEKMTMTVPRAPIYKKNTLAEPEKPASKYKKRQLHKSWLPTHIWHAKRAHMSAPKEPLWRFAIPIAPTNKCYRATHRAGSSSGCMAWDTSHMSMIGIEGAEASLIGLMRAVGMEEAILTGKKYVRWREGTRSWAGWLRERDGDQSWITKATICWCPAGKSVPGPTKEQKAEIEETLGSGHAPDAAGAQVENVLSIRAQPQRSSKKKTTKRKVLIRVHPASFLQIWEELLKVAKIQRPPPSVEDLRFQIGSIELIGPSSMEALAGVLHPVPSEKESFPETSDVSTTLTTLALINNTSSLPPNAIVPISVYDSRLFHPLRTVDLDQRNSMDEALTTVLSTWPFDNHAPVSSIFEFNDRQIASHLPTQKTINRRKGDASPGSYPKPIVTDPPIPALLLASRPHLDQKQQGTLTLLLPWKCVLPTWYSLMHYPLSVGGNPRFGGLDQKRQICFERGEPWFPGDFPGTKAGWEWELRERARRKEEWERRPRGRRIGWGSVDLGSGRKGEIGVGWGCDWERLFGPKSAIQSEDNNSKGADEEKKNKEKKLATKATIEEANPLNNNPHCPPLNIRHLPSHTFSTTTNIHPHALTTIHLTLLHRGRPEPCARIYRLPTNNGSLLQKWLTLASLSSASAAISTKQTHLSASQRSLMNKKDLPLHDRMRLMAESLLREPPKLATIGNGGGGDGEEGTDDDNDDEGDDEGDGGWQIGDISEGGEAGHHLPCPDEEDLIGFVTTANYDMGKGKAAAIGNVAVAKVAVSLSMLIATGEEGQKGGGIEGKGGGEGNAIASERPTPFKQREKGGLCIVRNAGQSVARLARWRLCG